MDDLKDLIAAHMDIYEFLDFIGLDFPELLNYLDDPIREHEDALRSELR
jgi:hypothetical protein